jgi:hypothetical protein
MAFDINSKANIAYKQVMGRAHTSNQRDFANEPYSSSPTILSQYVWGDVVATDPAVAQAAGVVSTLLTLNLSAVSGTDNVGGVHSSYLCRLGGTVPASLVGKINPITNAEYAPNDRVGNIIPAFIDDRYRPKLFANGVETPLLDASDWFCDTASGIVTQESDVPASMKNYATNGTLQAYVYIGRSVSETVTAAGLSTEYFDKLTVGNGITGNLNGTNKVFSFANTPNLNSEYIYLNGVLQMQPGDYTISGDTFTFENAPASDDLIVASYRVSAGG